MPINWMHYQFDPFIDLNAEGIVDICKYLEIIGLMPLKYGFSSTRPKYLYDNTRRDDVVKLCLDEGLTSIKGNDYIVEVAVSEQYIKPYIQSLKLRLSKRTDADYLIGLGVDLFRLFKSCQANAYFNWNSDSFMSGRSIEDCYPGFSWLNILGKPYIDMWGRDKIKEAPVHRVNEYDDIIVLIISEDPSLDSVSVKAKSNDLKEYFGHEYFYDSTIEHRKTVFKSISEIGKYKNETDRLVHYVAPDFHGYYHYRSGIWWFFSDKMLRCKYCG